MPNKEISATAFIVVSQSETLARGVCEAVISMAPNVVMASCGCHDEGLETATSLVKQSVLAMMDHLDADCSIVVMADFGAARMAVQKALTDLGNRNIVMGNGPFLEGFAAGVVAAQQGESLNAVLRSITSAAQFFPNPSDSTPGPDPVQRKRENPLAPRVLQVTDPNGMGPKPAAVFARRASEFDAQITLNGQDATSVLSLMGLHLSQGDQVTLAASGSQASIALEQLAELISSAASSNPKEDEGQANSPTSVDSASDNQDKPKTTPVSPAAGPGQLKPAPAAQDPQPTPDEPAEEQPEKADSGPAQTAQRESARRQPEQTQSVSPEVSADQTLTAASLPGKPSGQAPAAPSKPAADSQAPAAPSKPGANSQAPAAPDSGEPLSATAQLIRRLGISQLPK